MLCPLLYCEVPRDDESAERLSLSEPFFLVLKLAGAGNVLLLFLNKNPTILKEGTLMSMYTAKGFLQSGYFSSAPDWRHL